MFSRGKEKSSTPFKYFCISMQRNGTSSVGDFFEYAGFKRLGHQKSDKLKWSPLWFEGNFDEILGSEEFQNNEIFEDDPFWFPEFYKFLYHRVPNSRFILMDRNSDAWFKSMIRHSNGASLGITDIHAKVYRREDDLFWLEQNIDGFNIKSRQAMTLFDKSSHYKKVYEIYNQDVKNFFKRKPSERFFYCSLTDKDKWEKLAEWTGVDKKKFDFKQEVHVHKSKGSFTQEDLLLKRR